MAWLDVITPITPTNNSTEYTNYTTRMLIPAAAISNTGLALLRAAWFDGPTAQNFYITKAYVGVGADSGDAYDFAGTPTQLFFGGLAYTLVEDYKYTDAVIFSIPAGKNLVFSCYTEVGKEATDDMGQKTSMTGWNLYYKAGDDAATVNATGYTTVANVATGVLRVEASVAGPPKIKSINGVLIASVKSINGILIANVKSINGIT